MLTPTALRTRWALHDLARGGGAAMPATQRGVQAMGLRFASALGIAGGFDLAGALVGKAEGLGVGAVEIGSLCAGSRNLARALGALRRLDGQRDGAARVRHGVSLIKRASTPWREAHDELAGVLDELHGLADYVTLNPGRDRPEPAVFADAVAALARARNGMPLVVKMPSCWLRGDQATALAESFASAGADGLLLSAEGMEAREHLALLRRLGATVGICLISVGGIATPGDALRRRRAGAGLVQVHGALRRSQRRLWIRHACEILRRSITLRAD